MDHLLQERNLTLFYTTINRYKFCILNAHLTSEATRLNMIITFVARTLVNNDDTCSLHCPQMCTCLWAHDTCLLAEGVQTMRREYTLSA